MTQRQPPDFASLAKEWLDTASSDLQYALTGFQETEFYPQICFQCQQAAEKSLKAILVSVGQDPPRTHNLLFLFEQVKKHGISMGDLRSACEYLTAFYIETRYPPDIPPYRREDAEAALSYSKQIVETAQRIVAEKNTRVIRN